ncbi:MAG: aspartate kinase [Thermoplasmata archaeon]
MTVRPRRPLIVKFGGASLARPDVIVTRIRALRDSRSPVVLIVSAREGVTDELRGLIDRPRSTRAHREALVRIEEQHPDLSAIGRAHLADLHRLVGRVERRGRCDPSTADLILSFGERVAVDWLVTELRSADLPAAGVEADRLGLITDGRHGSGTIRIDRSAAAVRAGLGAHLRAGRIPVVTGFFGRSRSGRVVTLGRGGSDYSATAIGAILGARRVELIKRGVSVLTADPRLVPRARPIRRLSYEEAEELAQFGAKVLHPLTVQPARTANLEIAVRSLDDPREVTIIGPPRGPNGMRALTLLEPLGLVRIRVPGGRQRPGVVAEASQRLADARVNIVTLFTSSSLLSIVVERAKARAAARALAVLTRGGGASIEGPFPVGLLTAIGDGVLDDLGRIPPAILADGEGLSATPRSLSFAVPIPKARAALRVLHRALVEEAGR